MDEKAFDRLTRTVAVAPSRRSLLRLGAGLSISALAAIVTVVESGLWRRRDRRPHHHAPRQRRRRERRNTRSEACIPTGQRCPSKKPRGKKGKKLGCSRCCQGTFAVEAKGTRVC